MISFLWLSDLAWKEKERITTRLQLSNHHRWRFSHLVKINVREFFIFSCTHTYSQTYRWKWNMTNESIFMLAYEIFPRKRIFFYFIYILFTLIPSPMLVLSCDVWCLVWCNRLYMSISINSADCLTQLSQLIPITVSHSRWVTHEHFSRIWDWARGADRHDNTMPCHRCWWWWCSRWLCCGDRSLNCWIRKRQTS